jgi:hypothetical protein
LGFPFGTAIRLSDFAPFVVHGETRRNRSPMIGYFGSHLWLPSIAADSAPLRYHQAMTAQKVDIAQSIPKARTNFGCPRMAHISLRAFCIASRLCMSWLGTWWRTGVTR